MKRLLLLLSVLVVGALAACDSQTTADQAVVDPDTPLVTVYSSPA